VGLLSKLCSMFNFIFYYLMYYSLIYYIILGIKQTIPIFCKYKHFPQAINKLTHFLNCKTSTPALTELSLNIIYSLSKDPSTLAALSSVSNSVALLTSQTTNSNINATYAVYAKELIEALKIGSTSSKTGPSTSTPSDDGRFSPLTFVLFSHSLLSRSSPRSHPLTRLILTLLLL
jgi:hypothetical protein